MLSHVVDSVLLAAAGAGIQPLLGVGFVPVLHVERLQDDDSFARVLEFCRTYEVMTSRRAISTVITPLAPILANELLSVGFSHQAYMGRIAAVAEHSDIGLHGHFLRCPVESRRPVHNYWSDSGLVAKQMREESSWLETHGLMRTRVYSGGWWHLNRSVVAALVANGFEFDFTPSVGRYNDSPTARFHRRGSPNPALFEMAPGLHGAWAVSGICGSPRISAVPRRTLAAFGGGVRGAGRVVTLYSHDWDMDVPSAVRTLQDLQSHGAHFLSLGELASMRAVGSTTKER
ncbi:hypothetical protein H9645_09815 [Luteimonas sp. Sa2BVA3]|uniref:Polysaccharide deacetylase n=1 Tax=Luteimonas colneyensis TaxID=2762230 RepID=A0ABR8UJW8_9GAMM|nr:hypothetical protein [Luteimonas colneyensis]MBD7988323.1 hypothetical protein [Luteimonas colneyensis]